MSAVLASPRNLPRPPVRPRPTDKTGPSFAMALVMHALLFGALWFGVQWRTQSQPEVVAELWSAPPAEPVVAPQPEPVVVPPPAPPPVQRAPEPERPDADSVEQQRKKRLAEQKAAAERKAAEEKRKADEKRAADERRKADEKKKAEQARADEARAQAQRDAVRKAEQDRMMNQAGAPGTAAPGATGAGRSGDPSYADRVAALIKQHIEFAVPEGTSKSVFAEIQVDLLPTGEVMSVKLLKPSGLAGYDAAAERAIRRTGQLPRQRDGTVPRTLILRMRPVE